MKRALRWFSIIVLGLFAFAVTTTALITWLEATGRWANVPF